MERPTTDNNKGFSEEGDLTRVDSGVKVRDLESLNSNPNPTPESVQMRMECKLSWERIGLP